MIQYNAIVIGLGRIGMQYGFDPKRKQPASHIHAIINNPNLNWEDSRIGEFVENSIIKKSKSSIRSSKVSFFNYDGGEVASTEKE